MCVYIYIYVYTCTYTHTHTHTHTHTPADIYTHTHSAITPAWWSVFGHLLWSDLSCSPLPFPWWHWHVPRCWYSLLLGCPTYGENDHLRDMCANLFSYACHTQKINSCLYVQTNTCSDATNFANKEMTAHPQNGDCQSRKLRWIRGKMWWVRMRGNCSPSPTQPEQERVRKADSPSFGGEHTAMCFPYSKVVCGMPQSPAAIFWGV